MEIVFGQKCPGAQSISLVDPDGQPVSFSTWAYVLPDAPPDTDVLLGLPTLITKTGYLFLSYVKKLVDEHELKTTEPGRVGSDMPTDNAVDT